MKSMASRPTHHPASTVKSFNAAKTRKGFGLEPPACGIALADGQHRGEAVVVDGAPRVRVAPAVVAVNTPTPRPDLPIRGEPGLIVDQPPGGGSSSAPSPSPAPSPAPVAPVAGETCGQPRSMGKVTSGAFLGSLTMDSYYPDLVGQGVYQHPGSGGPFDTGSRAGANVQLIGTIPSPCQPGQYRLEQTITRTRFRINGTVHPEEGRTFDDIAKSGRDATTSPFRQEFLGGGSAPLGYIITMADPPSTGYRPTDSIDHDRDFVTSLVGPAGRTSVSWSLTTRIVNGRVTRNDLT